MPSWTGVHRCVAAMRPWVLIILSYRLACCPGAAMLSWTGARRFGGDAIVVIGVAVCVRFFLQAGVYAVLFSG
jgi:hypothetical protein